MSYLIYNSSIALGFLSFINIESIAQHLTGATDLPVRIDTSWRNGAHKNQVLQHRRNLAFCVEAGLVACLPANIEYFPP